MEQQLVDDGWQLGKDLGRLRGETVSIAQRLSAAGEGDASRALLRLADRVGDGEQVLSDVLMRHYRRKEGVVNSELTFPLVYGNRLCVLWGSQGSPLFGKRCRILARGGMNSRLVEFEDGTRHVVSGNALRRAK